MCDVGVSVAADYPVPTCPAELLRRVARVAVAPPGTPAHHVLGDLLGGIHPPALDIVETRSDAAALAMLAGGYADCAVSTLAAARHAGLTASPLGRAALDLVMHARVTRRDPQARALLQTLRSRLLTTALERAGYEPAAGHANTLRDPSLNTQTISARRTNMKSSPEVTI
jgi:hypothetical protein